MSIQRPNKVRKKNNNIIKHCHQKMTIKPVGTASSRIPRFPLPSSGSCGACWNTCVLPRSVLGNCSDTPCNASDDLLHLILDMQPNVWLPPTLQHPVRCMTVRQKPLGWWCDAPQVDGFGAVWLHPTHPLNASATVSLTILVLEITHCRPWREFREQKEKLQMCFCLKYA